MKMQTFLFFLILSNTLIAQNFTEKPQEPTIVGVTSSAGAFADIDGDGDVDLIITGSSNGIGRVTKLYTNDGLGNFAEVLGVPFAQVSNGALAFSDVDSDGDQDVLITGENDQEERLAKLYLNDGAGNFSEVLNTIFDGVIAGSVAFVDVDNDDDEDLVIVGTRAPALGISSKLYLNDGDGNFTESMNTSFEAVRNGSIAVADVDNDNDLDILIAGEDSSFEEVSHLYTNDGTGSFTLAANTPFIGIRSGSIAFADIDGDLDQDVCITGIDDQSGESAVLYKNDGLGNFTEVTNSPISPVQFSSIAFADVDNDEDLDLLINGRNVNTKISKLYLNDGAGNFTEMENTDLLASSSGFIAFADIDNDNDEDLLIAGAGESTNMGVSTITEIYLNSMTTSTMDISLAKVQMTLFPSPTNSKSLNVRIQLEEEQSVSFAIYDTNGLLVKQQQETLLAETSTVVLNLANLPAGAYVLHARGKMVSGSKFFVVE